LPKERYAHYTESVSPPVSYLPFDKPVESRVLLHASVTKIVFERVVTRHQRVGAEICGGLASGLLPTETVKEDQMSSKPVDHKDPGRVQGATVLGPGDFPIGSVQSRAAARLRLQKIGEVGKGSSECICFPEDEQPFFRTSEERDLAEGTLCPLHGKRFTPGFISSL
jgi:hypothetical protein